MNLIIFFKKVGEVELKLMSNKKLIDTLTFNFDANLDSVLIASVDKILKENRIETLSLKTISIAGEVDRNSSAYKIALSFIKAWKEAKKL